MTTTQTAKAPAMKGDPDPADLAQQIDQIKQEVAVLAQMLSNLATSQGAQLRDTAGELAGRAQGAGLQLLKGAKGQASAFEDEFERQVRERPFTCIVMAAGLGYVAGVLSRR